MAAMISETQAERLLPQQQAVRMSDLLRRAMADLPDLLHSLLLVSADSCSNLIVSRQ